MDYINLSSQLIFNAENVFGASIVLVVVRECRTVVNFGRNLFDDLQYHILLLLYQAEKEKPRFHTGTRK